MRKLKNLKGRQPKKVMLNFSGQNNELWCKGGEARFIKDLIFESRHFAKQSQWFTTLVSKASNLKGIYADLKRVKAKEVKKQVVL
ncbi:RlmF-related methyltransferase [uncultured Winogradskyella sp.]|uniref:RlmF-related methyltransferase n=1 Tax=uncultured Winogradskyella sp. TaxID=395353 RepID=UPI0026319195|nr:RlmF-related methyltransferase [uncultured Winogradskyella sp.]